MILPWLKVNKKELSNATKGRSPVSEEIILTICFHCSFLQVALSMLFEFVQECLVHYFTDAFIMVLMLKCLP
jgi:hypothetical protein